MVIKSRNPLMKRSIPNLVSHISGLGVALFSYFPKPAFFAKTGMSVHFTRNFNVLTTIFYML
jgi:hypothetical protein